MGEHDAGPLPGVENNPWYKAAAGIRVVTIEEAEAWLQRVVERGFSPRTAVNMADMMRYLPVIWGVYQRIIIQGRERKADILSLLEGAGIEDLVNGAGEKVGEVITMGTCPHCGANPSTAAEVIEHGNTCPGLG